MCPDVSAMCPLAHVLSLLFPLAVFRPHSMPSRTVVAARGVRAVPGRAMVVRWAPKPHYLRISLTLTLCPAVLAICSAQALIESIQDGDTGGGFPLVPPTLDVSGATWPARL